MAAVWHLPIVFVCENNQYGEFTPAADVVAGRVHERAAGYGIPGVVVDGQDAVAVLGESATAVERARHGDGPTLIEAETYRFGGHFFGEEALLGKHRYRSRDEVARWTAERDPLAVERSRLVAEGLAEEAALEVIDADTADEIEAARRFALDAALPDPEQALDFVFGGR